MTSNYKMSDSHPRGEICNFDQKACGPTELVNWTGHVGVLMGHAPHFRGHIRSPLIGVVGRSSWLRDTCHLIRFHFVWILRPRCQQSNRVIRKGEGKKTINPVKPMMNFHWRMQNLASAKLHMQAGALVGTYQCVMTSVGTIKMSANSWGLWDVKLSS